MALDRRTFMVRGIAAIGLAALPCAPLRAAVAAPARKLSFYHVHTGQWGKFTYWEQGNYVPEALLEINWFLRDFRNDTVTEMDKHLLDQLAVLQYMTGSDRAYEVISAYRSPQTNAMLYRTTDGVEEHSLHMRGQAVDVRLHGVELKNLHKAALSLKAGGVGYYPKSNFLHLDSGVIRSWG